MTRGRPDRKQFVSVRCACNRWVTGNLRHWDFARCPFCQSRFMVIEPALGGPFELIPAPGVTLAGVTGLDVSATPQTWPGSGKTAPGSGNVARSKSVNRPERDTKERSK